MDAPKLSDELDRWQAGEGDKTLGSIIDVFGEKSFAVLFVVLMGVPALPLPTGGATHVLEVVTVLLALELTRLANPAQSSSAISAAARAAPSVSTGR